MTGSLQIKNDIYYAVLNLKDINGNRKQKWISTGYPIKGNKKRAEQKLNQLLLEYDTIDYLKNDKVLFCDYLKNYVELIKHRIQTTTYDGYIHMINKHIYPYFNRTRLLLSNAKAVDFERYQTDRMALGLSPNTVLKHIALIRSTLQHAYKNRLITENCADLIEKPKKKKYQPSFYDIDEANKLFSCTLQTKIELPIVLACFYGLRRSEVLGVRWDFIDFENKVFMLKMKVVRVKDDNGKIVSEISDVMKTEHSYRSLPLSDFMINYLQSVKQRMLANMKFFGDNYNQEYLNYLCVDEMGNLIKPDYITHTYAKVLKKNSLRKIRYHDLRHSCASILYSLGYDLKDIQIWLGHSDFKFTANVYTHLKDKVKFEIIEKMNSSLEFNKC